MKDKCNDADLILVSHGHFDHSSGAPVILKNSQANGKEPLIVTNYDLMHYYMDSHEVEEKNTFGANKGALSDFGFCQIALVGADHSSGCPGKDGPHSVCYGGNPVGFIIKADGITIYHAGDTGVFGDMAIINDLYRPDYALLPIGGRFTMGPREAAYALKKLLTHVSVVIPMHY